MSEEEAESCPQSAWTSGGMTLKTFLDPADLIIGDGAQHLGGIDFRIYPAQLRLSKQTV
jgi:hypothetical protein